jgi:hypothetical protein
MVVKGGKLETEKNPKCQSWRKCISENTTRLHLIRLSNKFWHQRKTESKEVLGRTNTLLSFDTTRTAQKKKKIGGRHRHTDSKVIS